MRSVFLLLLMVITFLANAQWYDPEKVDHDASTLFNLAYGKAKSGEYEQSIKLLLKSIEKDPKFVDAYLSLGGVYGEMKNYTAAVQSFEKALSMDSVYARYYLLPYSIDLAGAGRFDDAMQAVQRFLAIKDLNDRSRKSGEFRKQTYQFALNYAMAHSGDSYVFAPMNLGDSINTENLEYFPSLTIDGKKLIFTRRVASNEDFYESDLVNGKWSKAKPLTGDINSPQFNEGAQNISQDGTWLIFTGCNFPEGMGSCDLYISFLTKTGWSRPQNMGRSVNSRAWESTPSLSPDKRDLYFSSNMQGGFGGNDIWVCHREDGTWSKPYNLGPAINTSGNEGTPFIHADNLTLYFNSNGHPGYSDQPDLFVSAKNTDGSWGTPRNMGYPVNTIDDEGSLIVTADGRTAYYSSDRANGKGGLDIYSFELRKDLRPLKTLWVKGQVYDAKTKVGLPSTVELTDLKTNKVVSQLQTDEWGNYLITLPVGKDYAFNVHRKGYLFYSEHYQLDENIDSVFTVDIPLQPLGVHASIVLKNVFFDTKDTSLKPASITELDRVALLMQENPSMKIEILGYTDNVGTEADNLKLSRGRAIAVVHYLISKGIARDRLTYKGMGESDPLADNSTEAGRARNRRTEMKITGF